MAVLHPDYWHEELVNLVPELQPEYADLQEAYGEEVGGHMFYGLVVRPYLEQLLRAAPERRGELERLFEALEKLAVHNDGGLTNLLAVSVFEDFDQTLLTLARSTMRERVRAISLL